MPVVVGGGAFTVAPEAILKYLGMSYGIVGEGEQPFCRFVEAYPERKKIAAIPGMVFVGDGHYKVNPRAPFSFDESIFLGQRESRFHYA